MQDMITIITHQNQELRFWVIHFTTVIWCVSVVVSTINFSDMMVITVAFSSVCECGSFQILYYNHAVLLGHMDRHDNF